MAKKRKRDTESMEDGRDTLEDEEKIISQPDGPPFPVIPAVVSSANSGSPFAPFDPPSSIPVEVLSTVPPGSAAPEREPSGEGDHAPRSTFPGPIQIKIPSEKVPFLIVESADGGSATKFYMNSAMVGGCADFAEYFETDKSAVPFLRPGAVVNLREGRVTLTGFDQDHIVPRIISTQPLFVGNSREGDDSSRALLALVGQVSVILPLNKRARPGDYVVAGTAYGEVLCVPPEELAASPWMQGRVCGVALEASRLLTDSVTGGCTNSVFTHISYSPASSLQSLRAASQAFLLETKLSVLEAQVQLLRSEALQSHSLLATPWLPWLLCLCLVLVSFFV